MNKSERMKELIKILNEASKAYYQESREIMDNFQYDALYDELLSLEKETGIVFASSPTKKVGYELLSELPREIHDKPMLSLDKTKSRQDLQEWLNDKEGLLSWKLDGLTIVLTYENGTLLKAVTRGNGEIGEVITNNTKTFVNLPLSIPYKGKLVLRGEAIIPYSTFEKINSENSELGAKYKNPRNLCSGSVRQLNNEITAKRGVHFYAFALVSLEESTLTTREEEFLWLKDQGFEVVEYQKVTASTILSSIDYFEEKLKTNDHPSDGLVLIYNDIAYGLSLGQTAKFPKDSIAFKWADEVEKTTLKEIEWSASRTGLINPVAIFEPVELEGTTVSRASVHNVSIVKSLELGIGDTIEVFKANMIIPQIARNLTKSKTVKIPSHCPVCGGETKIQNLNDVETLYCTNSECPAKKIKGFSLFVSRNAMNIDGLSEATLEKFVDLGFIKRFIDLYHLEVHKEDIVQMEGFGEKSYTNLQKAIKTSRHTTLSRLVYALGIENIGVSTAKLICNYFNNDSNKLKDATIEELSFIDGIGDIIATSYVNYFKNAENRTQFDELLAELVIESEESNEEPIFKGKTFVITGSLTHFENRDQLKAEIEKRGGKVTGSVTKKTSYLITNDKTSGSSKNKKANELQIPIISEEDYLKLQNEEL
ncbi:DNA ligase [Lachnospiraceae bacterium TWA4]|nr:DNA ligase [Lachnospiraceae bacterium TWA4]